jgi:hypothetical protein
MFSSEAETATMTATRASWVENEAGVYSEAGMGLS